MRVVAKPLSGRSNPVVDLLYDEVRKSGIEVFPFSLKIILFRNFDVFHMHWPDNVFRSKFLLVNLFRVLLLALLLQIFKWKKVKVVWTAHNVDFHESARPFLSDLYWRCLNRKLDGIIFLSESSRKRFFVLHPEFAGKVAKVILHGHYCDVFAGLNAEESIFKHKVKKEILSSRYVVGHCGLIRRYKNVDRLFDISKNDSEIFTICAGKIFEEDYREELLSQVDGLDNVFVEFSYLDDIDIKYLVTSMDMFVLPYDKITNSGTAIMALSLGVPVLVPDVTELSDLVFEFENEWVFTYPVGELNSSLIRSKIDLFRRYNPDSPSLQGRDWFSIAQSTNDFYKQVIYAKA